MWGASGWLSGRSRPSGLTARIDRNDNLLFVRQPRETLPDRVGHIVRREMRVVVFGHAGVGMDELSHRPHGEQRAVGVAQHMEAGGRRYAGVRTGFPHGAERKILPTFCLISVGKPPRTSSDKFNAKPVKYSDRVVRRCQRLSQTLTLTVKTGGMKLMGSRQSAHIECQRFPLW